MIDERRILLLAAAVLLLVGLTFGCVSIAIAVSRKNKRKACTRRTKGVVTNMERRRISGSMGDAPMLSWFPTFTYEANGHTIEKTSLYGAAKQNFYIDQKVTVFYNPQNPNEYFVQEEDVAGIQKIFLAVSIVLLLCGGIAVGCYLFIGG